MDHSTESVCLLNGHLEILIFNSEGAIGERHQLTADAPLIDIEPRTWHAMIVLAPDTVVFETKQGPYDPDTDKTYAPWAPEEDAPEVGDFLARLAAEA